MSRAEPWALELLGSARVGRLGTAGADGAPLVVPICYALLGGEESLQVVTAIDAKPKSAGPLRRARNVAENPRATLLVDVWDEDWRKLAWVMVDGASRLLAPGGADDTLRREALRALEVKYPQYRELPLDPATTTVITLVPDRVRAWRYAGGGVLASG